MPTPEEIAAERTLNHENEASAEQASRVAADAKVEKDERAEEKGDNTEMLDALKKASDDIFGKESKAKRKEAEEDDGETETEKAARLKAEGDDGETETEKAARLKAEEDDGETETEKAARLKAEEDAKPKITDDMLTRAVKAGMTIGDARKFNDPELLERMIQRVPGDAGNKPGDEDEDPLVGIKKLDLSEFEDDDPVAKGFNQMIDIIGAQSKKLADLTEGSVETAQAAWLKTKFDDVPAESQTLLDTGTRLAIKDQFDALQAGYNALGKDVDVNALFEQASSSVLGTKAASNTKKVGKAKARAASAVNKPKGSIGSKPPRGKVTVAEREESAVSALGAMMDANDD